MHEFAFGASSAFSHFGPVRNPWNLAYSPGGSSGGSAAAVAGQLCYAALGSDTGGSIREPAAYCGIVGLKPTYGRVSTSGAIPLSWSLDHLGPMTRTVSDAALLLEAIAGYDPQDPGSTDVPVPDYAAAIEGATVLARRARRSPRRATARAAHAAQHPPAHPAGAADHLRPVWHQRRALADRTSDQRRTGQRGEGAAAGARLRARDRVATERPG